MQDRSASQLLAGTCRQSLPLICRSASASAGLVHGYTYTSKLVTGGEEALARVTFVDERFMFFAELIPELMEVLVMGAVDYVAKSIDSY